MATPNPQRSRDEDVIRLFRHLFQNRYSVAENVPPHLRANVTPAHFYGWVDSQLSLMDPATECEAAGVPVDPVWAFLREIVEGGLAPERMQQFWYWICMPDRPDPKVPLADLHCVLLLTWADGRLLPISTHVVPDMLGPGQAFTDPIVAQLVRNNVIAAFLHAIVREGLDALHDQAKDFRGPGPVDAYDTFAGVFARALKEGFAAGRPEGMLREADRPWVEQYFRLAQALIRPPIPPEVRAMIQARNRRELAEREGRVAGGWDV